MKRVCYFVYFLFAMAVMFVMKANVASASATQIYPEAAISDGNCIKIPVAIKNNPGLMGYVVNLEFDKDYIMIESIEAGNISDSGLFDNNIGVKDDGVVSILWSNTAEIKQDGVLFYINVSVLDEINEQTHIVITYSPNDTFNEKYEEVKLECKDIVISENKNEIAVEAADKEQGMSSEKDVTGKNVANSADKKTKSSSSGNKIDDKNDGKIENDPIGSEESLEEVLDDEKPVSEETEPNVTEELQDENSKKDAADTSGKSGILDNTENDNTNKIIIVIGILIILLAITGTVFYRKRG